MLTAHLERALTAIRGEVSSALQVSLGMADLAQTFFLIAWTAPVSFIEKLQPDHYTESKRDLKTSNLPIFSFFRMFALDIGVPGSSPIQCFSLHFLLFFKKSSYNTFLLKSSIKCLRTHFVYVCYQNLLTYSPASKINVVTIVSMEHLSTSEKFRANRGSFDMTWLSLSCFSYCIWQVKAHQPAALFVISHFHNCILELPVFCPHVLTWPLQVLDCWLHKVSVSSVYSFR